MVVWDWKVQDLEFKIVNTSFRAQGKSSGCVAQKLSYFRIQIHDWAHLSGFRVYGFRGLNNFQDQLRFIQGTLQHMCTRDSGRSCK